MQSRAGNVQSTGSLSLVGGESARESPLGWWRPDRTVSVEESGSWRTILGNLRSQVIVVRTSRGLEAALGGDGSYSAPTNPRSEAWPIAAYLPAVDLSSLGDARFLTDHGLRYPYVSGAMANGIGSVEIVEAMSRAGMLAFFGAAGLPLERIDAAIQRLHSSLCDRPNGFNLIHSPNEPDHEAATVELYLRKGVHLIEASAYLDLTLPLVRYRLHGIHRDPSGQIVPPNRVIAKASRVEVATKFFRPAPDKLVRDLVGQGHVTEEQADLARRIPVAQDVTAEADSGGHTDNRPAIALLPTLLACRDRVQKQFGYPMPLRVGLAGGISTPESVAAAFAMGAAYVLTGSINQACVESGSSETVRAMLAEAGQADVAMAPAADMFELGVKVQVLKRGTMFPMRATKLYELYRAYPSLDALPASERSALERNLFRSTVEEVWQETRDYFLHRDPRQVERAEADPKHLMALVFRWYLGQSSRWANAGEPSRKVDYQVWCGPAMGAFNEWAKGSYLEIPGNRKVAEVAFNLLYGAAVLSRQTQLRIQGVELPREAFPTEPMEPSVMAQHQVE
jgi:trans-AT polyketide synthase, acyltransferase and oxidoreductase domains